jgi:xylitol oxidase
MRWPHPNLENEAMSPTRDSDPGQAEFNWAGNYRYSGRVVRPQSVEALQEMVAGSAKVGFLGSRHSFNAIADSEVLIDMRALPPTIEVDPERRFVIVSGGTTYGALAPVLEQHGLALANLASLPHISVAGAICTGTHGSGAKVGSLATAVRALEIVRADGEIVCLTREHPDFAGAVVSLGALGAIVRVKLDVEPTYQVAQSVTEHIPWSSLTDDLRAVMSSAYSVSLFTWWDGEVSQAWVKARADDPRPGFAFDAGTPATRELHPLGDLDPSNCTPQLGVPGPWFERLPHFRLGFTPSNGEELQSEFLLDWDKAGAAIEAIQRLGPLIRPLLLISEVRTIAHDELWLSTAHDRDSLAIHFTWRRDPAAVDVALGMIEPALLALGARPHWGKVSLAGSQQAAASYPMLNSFVELADRFDPRHAFRNDWLYTHVFGADPITG